MRRGARPVSLACARCARWPVPFGVSVSGVPLGTAVPRAGPLARVLGEAGGAGGRVIRLTFAVPEVGPPGGSVPVLSVLGPCYFAHMRNRLRLALGGRGAGWDPQRIRRPFGSVVGCASVSDGSGPPVLPSLGERERRAPLPRDAAAAVSARPVGRGRDGLSRARCGLGGPRWGSLSPVMPRRRRRVARGRPGLIARVRSRWPVMVPRSLDQRGARPRWAAGCFGPARGYA